VPSVDFIKTFGSPEKPTPPPRTLEELSERLGPLGEAAVERTEWEAVIRWLNRRPEGRLDPVKKERDCQAIGYYMEARAAQSAVPGVNSEAPYLCFHRSRQSRVKKTAMALREQWRAAGQQCLGEAINYVAWTMRAAMDGRP